MARQRKAQIIIPAGLCPWPHELRVAQILSLAGHTVEFLPTRSSKTADILLDGIAYEIKSPRTNKTNTLEHLIKKALRQSSNIIIDSSRTNGKLLTLRHSLAIIKVLKSCTAQYVPTAGLLFLLSRAKRRF